MIGKRNVLEHHAVVVFVERRPAAVLALHRQDPVDGALHRFALVAPLLVFTRLSASITMRAVIDIGIKLVVELEVPAAGRPS